MSEKQPSVFRKHTGMLFLFEKLFNLKLKNELENNSIEIDQ